MIREADTERLRRPFVGIIANKKGKSSEYRVSLDAGCNAERRWPREFFNTGAGVAFDSMMDAG
jgi:hypothetical protein